MVSYIVIINFIHTGCVYFTKWQKPVVAKELTSNYSNACLVIHQKFAILQTKLTLELTVPTNLNIEVVAFSSVPLEDGIGQCFLYDINNESATDAVLFLFTLTTAAMFDLFIVKTIYYVSITSNILSVFGPQFKIVEFSLSGQNMQNCLSRAYLRRGE